MTTRQHSKHGSVWLSLAVSALLAAEARANPTGPTVVNGQVVIDSSQAGVLTITNSPNAIINWQGFSINANEVTRFIQQSADSAVLNRVVGQDPSVIMGQLLSNGQVFLINPNGIIFGQGSVVDTAGLLASTLNISNDDFLRGNYLFVNPGKGGIENYGMIHVGNGGSVVLMSPNIQNSGLIQSDGGHLVLAAGERLTLTSMDSPQIRFEIQAPTDKVLNIGQLMANGGGSVDVFAATIQHSGAISADSVQVDQSGQIHLVAQGDVTLERGSSLSADGPQGGNIHVESQAGTTLASGAIHADGSAGKGGSIQVLGEKVALLDGAQVSASGQSGGGQVLVGGDYQGKNPEVKNAQQTYVAANAHIRADALANGDGGKVVTWSDLNTRFAGSISARGGSAGGNGGMVEVSGKDKLTFAGTVDTAAPKGHSGSLVLDPTNISIVSGGLAIPPGLSSDPFWAATDDPGNQTITIDTIASLLTSNSLVTLQAADSITWQAGATLNYSNLGTSTLTLQALGSGASAISLLGSNAVTGVGGTASDLFTLNLYALNGGVTIANGAIAKGTGTSLGVEIVAGAGGVTGTAGGGADITADKLAVTSAGSVLLDTAVSSIAGSVSSGNFTLTNVGALRVEKSSTAVGAIYAPHGSININNTGSIEFSGDANCDYTSCASLTAYGNIDVTASGGGANITSGSISDSSLARSYHGHIALTADGDINLGSSTHFMDIYAHNGDVSLNAGGGITALRDSWVYTNFDATASSGTEVNPTGTGSISFTAHGAGGIVLGSPNSADPQPEIHAYGLGTVSMNAPNGPITQYLGAVIGTDRGQVSLSALADIQLLNGITFANTIGDITLSTSGVVSSFSPLTANVLTLNGTGGQYLLDGLDNDVAVLRGNTGTVAFRDDNGFTVGGLTTAGNTALQSSSGTINFSGTNVVGGDLTNTGTAQVSDGSLSVAGVFGNSGALNFVNAAPVSVSAAAINADSINITGGQLAVSGTASAPQQFANRVTLNGPVTVNDLTLWGQLDSNSSITVNRQFDWIQGVIGGTGASLLTAGVTHINQRLAELTGSRVWTNTGTISLGGNGGLADLNLWDQSELQNRNGIEIFGASLGGNSSVGIVNARDAGTIYINGGQTTIDARFANDGWVVLNGGGLSIHSSGTDSGAYNVTGSGHLDFSGGTTLISRTFNGTISDDGTGTVGFANGGFVFNSAGALDADWVWAANAKVFMPGNYQSHSGTEIWGGLFNVGGTYTQLADGYTDLWGGGTLATQSVTVDAGGGFEGQGVVDLGRGGAFTNNGWVGIADGPLTINGNYLQTATGELAIGLGGTYADGSTSGYISSPGSLMVNGSATVEGSLLVWADMMNSTSTQTSFRVIDTTDGLFGGFSKVEHYPDWQTLAYQYDGMGLTVNTLGISPLLSEVSERSTDIVVAMLTSTGSGNGSLSGGGARQDSDSKESPKSCKK